MRETNTQLHVCDICKTNTQTAGGWQGTAMRPCFLAANDVWKPQPPPPSGCRGFFGSDPRVPFHTISPLSARKARALQLLWPGVTPRTSRPHPLFILHQKHSLALTSLPSPWAEQVMIPNSKLEKTHQGRHSAVPMVRHGVLTAHTPPASQAHEGYFHAVSPKP